MKWICVIMLILPIFLQGKSLVWEDSKKDIHVKIVISALEINVNDYLQVFIYTSFSEDYRLDMNSIKNGICCAGDEDLMLSIVSEEEDSCQHAIVYTLEPLAIGHCYIYFSNIRFVNEHYQVDFFPDVFEVDIVLPSDFSKEVIIPDLLPLDNKLPIKMTWENRNKLKNNDGNLHSDELLQFISWYKRASYGWIFVMIGLLVMSLFIFSKKKKIIKKNEVKEQLSPKEKALNEIEKLISMNLLDSGDVERFYVLLTSIERVYVEEQFHIKAPERTTQEFLEELCVGSLFDMKTQDLLKNFLTHADLVKFARHSPSLLECNQAIESAKKFIEDANLLEGSQIGSKFSSLLF